MRGIRIALTLLCTVCFIFGFAGLGFLFPSNEALKLSESQRIGIYVVLISSLFLASISGIFLGCTSLMEEEKAELAKGKTPALAGFMI
jgi:hypothetical protein